jgi:hypothetical protein
MQGAAQQRMLVPGSPSVNFSPSFSSMQCSGSLTHHKSDPLRATATSIPSISF